MAQEAIIQKLGIMLLEGYIGQAHMVSPLYVIFGYEGLLGKAFYFRICGTIPDYRMFCFEHSHVDISNRSQVREVLSYVEPTVVVNCAGLSDPAACEASKSGAFEANAVGPKILAEECRRIQAKLVHFSSFHVFRGDKHKPYGERDRPMPINSLGKSKLEGERAIRATHKDHLIIRPGWLFDSQGCNFVPEWTERIDKGLSIVVQDDVHGSPSYVPDVVQYVLELVNRDAKGVFHVANGGTATWQGLAETVCGLMRKRPMVVAVSGKSLMGMPPVPAYSVLSCAKLQSATGIATRPWTDSLKQCLFQAGRYKP